MEEKQSTEDLLKKLLPEQIEQYFCSNPEWFWGYNLNRLSWFKAGMESVDFMLEHLYNVHQVNDRLEHLGYVLDQLEIENGLLLEFGVGHKGESISRIANSKPNETVYGFDSFRGLPEKWGNVMPKGSFYNFGKPPEKSESNIQFVKGLFDDTLPDFLKENEGPCSFIHVDCDLYSSTKCVLDNLTPRIQSGTVIAFDEFFNYPGWQKHEFLAWMEFVKQNKVTFDYVSFNASGVQLAVKIKEIHHS